MKKKLIMPNNAIKSLHGIWSCPKHPLRHLVHAKKVLEIWSCPKTPLRHMVHAEKVLEINFTKKSLKLGLVQSVH